MMAFDRRYVLIPVIAALLLVIVGLVANEIGRNSLIGWVQEIQRSEERARLLVEIQSLVTDAETAQRGYILTGDASYLEPFEKSKRAISSYLTEVQKAYGTSSAEAPTDMQDSAAKVIELSSAKMTELESTIALYKDSAQKALTLVKTNIGQERMESLRSLVAEMRAQERNSVVQKTGSWLALNQKQRVLFSIGVALNILLIMATGVLVLRELKRRHALTSNLEAQVQQKTQELSELSTHLQKVSESEKFALARELHDELGGLLIAIKMDLAQLKTRIDLSQPEMQKRWERMQAALSAGIDLKRRIIEQLRPSLLDNMGLIAAVRWQLGEITTAANLKLEEHYPEIEPSITSDSAIAIYRILQEAIANIVKHARASQIVVNVELTQYDLVATIEDDGVGISENSLRAGGPGITSMKHRLLPFGGKFTIERATPKGTRVRLVIPLAAIEREDTEEAA